MKRRASAQSPNEGVRRHFRIGRMNGLNGYLDATGHGFLQVVKDVLHESSAEPASARECVQLESSHAGC